MGGLDLGTCTWRRPWMINKMKFCWPKLSPEWNTSSSLFCLAWNCFLVNVMCRMRKWKKKRKKKTFPVFTHECIIKKFVTVGCGWCGNILWQKLIWWGVILAGALLGQAVFFFFPGCVLGENNSPPWHFWLEPPGREGKSDRVIALGFLLTKLTSAWKFIGLLFLKII